MKIDFLTLPKYAGAELDVTIPQDPLNEMTGTPFETDTASRSSGILKAVMNEKSPLRQSINKVIQGPGYADQINAVTKLVHDDINRLGNELYRIEGARQNYLLKVLNAKKPCNVREMLVWKSLGFNRKDGSRNMEGRAWMPGLPKSVSVLEAYNSLILPFYSGVLRPVIGGSHELPLVLYMLLFFVKTFRQLHQEGWLYMDFHPSNILFKKSAKNALLFFITDMGSARPLCDDCQTANREWKELNDKLKNELCKNRWTKAEVAPPDKLFPLKKDGCPASIHPSYDFYTMARTAFILSGFELEFNEDYDRYRDGLVSKALENYDDDFVIEKPLAPLREEVKQFYDIMVPVLFEKKEPDSNKIYQLFKGFFKKRAKFSGIYLGDSHMGRQWQATLLKRLELYHIALAPEDKKNERFKQEIRKLFQTRGSRQVFGQELNLLNQLPRVIAENRDHAKTEQLLKAAAESQLVRVSEIACYAYAFHRKVFRLLYARPVKAPLLESSMNQLPEKKTLRQLKKQRHTELKLLTRQCR